MTGPDSVKRSKEARRSRLTPEREREISESAVVLSGEVSYGMSAMERCAIAPDNPAPARPSFDGAEADADRLADNAGAGVLPGPLRH
ncbi:hypothetical protein ACFRIB_49940 [Streptomyces mirabilis]|uniref:hypothetical protein n=1 Tax=Streptomyces mirabilis TaxID=68239 RepID=UPI0036CDF613